MINTIRGFRDILPPNSSIFSKIEEIAREIFKIYNYTELRIPTVEYQELFIKSTGETTDIVEKEMYSFNDQSDRLLALRPEGTPGIVRAYINNNLGQNSKNSKFYYMGNMFRAERPQAGRFREFEQIGAEKLGDPSSYSDAELIIMLNEIILQTGIKDFDIEINSIGCSECRKKYRETLIAYLKTKKDLCQQCQNRIERNPLRVLDCKIDRDKLKDIPAINLCNQCLEHHNNLKKTLDISKVKYNENRFLVRGLDYYTRTVFEFKTNMLGSQDAIAAGGRYDNLVKSMGGQDIPGTGWAMGVDRLAILMEKNFDNSFLNPEVFIVCMDKKYADYSFTIINALRKEKISTDFTNLFSGIKSQMRAADKSNAKYAIIIGEDEFKEESCSVKDMQNKTQIKIKKSELINYLREKL